MRFATPCFVLLLSMMSAIPALSWQEGVDHDSPLECNGLPLADADRIVVRVLPKDGSYNLPKLVGLKGDNVLWSHNFPKAEEVNTAKFEVSCQATTIKLWSQSPMRSAATVQEYSWNGKQLKLKKSWVENESREKIKYAIKTVAAGQVESIDPWELEIPYADDEVTKDLLIIALGEGQKSASSKYKMNKIDEAIKILGAMFDLTAKLVFFYGNASDIEKEPFRLELWLKAWKAKEIESHRFITALNDYGFYLQQEGSHADAIKIFEKIKEIEPNRIANHLNLADSLWETGQKEKAIEIYEKYSNLMNAKQIHKQLPSRVIDRIKKL